MITRIQPRQQSGDANGQATDWPIPLTGEALVSELVRLRDHFALAAQSGDKRHSGTGSWWEFSGYADGLSDAIDKIVVHGKRAKNIDRQIAREQAESTAPAVGHIDQSDEGR